MEKRQFLKFNLITSAVALLQGSFIGSVFAQSPAKIMVIGHAAHRSALVNEKRSDVVAEWVAKSKTKVEWLTLGVPEIHDRIFKEASLDSGAFDVAFLANRYISPKVATLFEPLDDLLLKFPVENMDDFPKGMLDTFTFNGKLYGIPFRQATSGLLFNKTLLAERGLSGPPKTVNEFIEYAKKLTFTRPDGSKVYGLVTDGPGISQMIDLSRMYDGDLISLDMKLKVGEPGMIKGLALMKDFYNSGVLPREFVKFQTENVISFMQQGRAAMAITPISRFTQLNNPDSSRFPGQIVAAALPVSDELKAKYGFAPVKSEFWVLAIPKNAKNKSASWDFIRYASTPDASLKAGLNGNGPVRRSTLTDKKYRDSIPYAEAEAAALKFARPPLPGWENSSKVEDIFRDEVESMLITASKTPQETVTNIAKLVGPLLPK